MQTNASVCDAFLAQCGGLRLEKEQMMGDSASKALLHGMLATLGSSDTAEATLANFAHAGCRWEVFHPFNRLDGNAAAVSQFFSPLRNALPDYEHRSAFMLAGSYEGRDMVSSWGHLIGTFDRPLLGIPPTCGMAFLRFGIHATVRDGLFSHVYVLLDLVDLMRQAGVYPFRPMPGSAEQWPFPPSDTGASSRSVDPEQGKRTLKIVQEMQSGLPPAGAKITSESAKQNHSHHWHTDMNWYGPAGIGSSRGRRGFRDFHGALFLQAFGDRTGFARMEGGPADAPGHFIRLGDGNYAVTSGWPSLHGTHTGGEWLGLPPTGRKIEMRVADWYRLDEQEKIIDNWVMIDIPHIVHQMGLDIFHDLKFRVDPSIERLPEPPLAPLGQ